MQERRTELVAEDFIRQAQSMSEWFGDYIDGATDDMPSGVPRLTRDRLGHYFGNVTAVDEQLAMMRDNLLRVAPEHQTNLAAYFCGFPLSLLRELELDVTVEESKMALELVLFEKEQRAQQQKVGGQSVAATRYRGEDYPQDQDEMNWQKDALCAQTDPEAFFPEKGGSTRDAKKICADCDVRARCLEYALEKGERFGIWGGLNALERRKLKKASAAEAETAESD